LISSSGLWNVFGLSVEDSPPERRYGDYLGDNKSFLTSRPSTSSTITAIDVASSRGAAMS
jgi:hypothetical protein